eukprot:CAMPEP_0194549006 /NCGR_PEP_ID=MMETSP0253-20130528/94546_1 /TAXON_ID=2966 /ORGANISM="Noctiluca scintillans" /LENGTH=89 /DNA_ID=CAMNT_0039396389 /DNA_START=91 /DNA_END=361 /DNA_ORIENTATION=+
MALACLKFRYPHILATCDPDTRCAFWTHCRPIARATPAACDVFLQASPQRRDAHAYHDLGILWNDTDGDLFEDSPDDTQQVLQGTPRRI